MHVEVQMAPAYLRELRATGQTAALRMLAEETKPPPEEEEVEEVDEEDEEERRHRLEMQRIKEEREFKAMMKENPPALQALTKLFEKVDKKFLKIRKEALEQQVRIDEPGHSDFFVDRLVRLKNECLEKIGDVVSTPSAALLEKAVALDLPESVTCKAFVERLNVVLQESKWLLEMTSMQHFEDLHNGVTVEERAVIIAEQKRVEREAREEKRAAEAAAAATVAGDIEGSSATEGVARSGTAEPEGHGNDQRGHDSRKHPHEEQSLEADAVVHSMASGKAKSHKHKSHKHNHDTDRAGPEVLEEHWQRPDAKTRMENKKNLHKHHPDAAQQASINAAQIEGEAYVQDAGDNA